MLILRLSLPFLAVALAILAGLPDYGPVQHGTREFRRRRALWIALSISFLCGSALTEYLTYRATQAAEVESLKQRSEYLTQIRSLHDAIAHEERAHGRENKQALAALDVLQARLADLQGRVATHELRAQLEKYQKELHAARTVLAPPPKVRLQMFAVGGDDPGHVLDPPSAEQHEGFVRVRLILRNHFSEDAGAGSFWVRICDGCELVTVPEGFTHLSTARPGEYIAQFTSVATNTMIGPYTFDIKLPSGNCSRVGLRLKYACQNCIASPEQELIAYIQPQLRVFRTVQLP